VVGAAILNNYDQMKSMQDTLKYLSQNMEEVQSIVTENRLTDTIDSKTTVVKGQSSDVSSEETEAGQQEQTDASADTPDNSLDVEVVPGKVDPIEENGNQETPEKKETKPAKKDDEESSPTEKPASKESKENTKQTEAKKENKINYYIVVEGDTLADISYKLYKTYTRVNKIMELNNIDNQDLIYVGQKLIVP
jgi:nucleoid-associated protein YgaU